MTSDRPARRVRWSAVAGPLVALAVLVPLLALVLADDRPAYDDAHRTDVATAASAPLAAPLAAPTATPAPTTTRGTERAATRALFFGDSYFIGGGYTGKHNSMARIASRRLGWKSVINGGGGTGFVSTNWDYGLGSYLDQIAAGAFDVGARRWVVIQGGNNDRGQPLDQVRANARKVLRIAQRTFPRARVVLVGPTDNDADHSDLTPIAQVLRKVAARRGVPYVNSMNWLAGHYDLIGPDTIHPYPKGHRIMGRKLAKALRKLSR